MSEDEKLGVRRGGLYFWRKSCVARALEGKHCLIIGATGTGKTWWIAEVAKRHFHRFIFVNPNMEEVVETICTTQCTEPEEVLSELLANERKIEFRPDEDTAVALRQLKELRLGLFEIAEDIDAHSGVWWLEFILDEAQTYAWKGSRQDVDVFATRGRRYGIRSWFVTQRPQNISSTICNNVENQIIFRTGPYETPYFKNYRIPIEGQSEWLQKKYHYVLYDGFDVSRCDPITGKLARYHMKQEYDI
jgi:DNA helicase HerA-like ATPase